MQPSGTSPGPRLLTFVVMSEHIGVALMQSLLSVVFAPFPAVAHGTQEKVADHPEEVIEASEVNLNVRHPEGLFAVKLKGTVGLPDILPFGTVAGAVVKTGEFCVAPLPIVRKS